MSEYVASSECSSWNMPCSRVYASEAPPFLASSTQCSSRAIVGSISRRFRSAMMTRNVSMTSFNASNRSRRSPMMCTRRTTPQVISSRRLVETFDVGTKFSPYDVSPNFWIAT